MFRKLILVSAISVALLPHGAAALGLGAMRAQSALNQPFFGEIDLLDARPDELDTVKARLASPEAFTSAGAERFHFLTKLQFVPQLSSQGRPIVRVTSSEPVREPYLALLVEVIWPTGRMVREYSILLDPPATSSRPAPRVTPPPVSRPAVSRPAPPPAPKQPARQRRPAPPTPAVAPVAATPTGGYPLRYGPIPAGAGLWRVAKRIAPDGATVPQTAMALYRNNQHAFAAADINRLLLGQVLEVPNEAELMALDPAAAEREFQAALSGKKVRRTPLTDAAVRAASAGPTQLKIAGTGTEQPADGGATVGADGIDNIEQELLLVREAGESTRQETDHLRDRIKQLETQLVDIQRLLMLRNQQLAELQSSSAQADGPQVPGGVDAAPDALRTDVESALAAVAGPEGLGSVPSVDEGLDLIDTGDVAPLAADDELAAAVDIAAAEADGGAASSTPDVLLSDQGTGDTGDDGRSIDATDQDAVAETAEAGDATEQPMVAENAGETAAKAEPIAVRSSPEVIEPPSFLDSLPLPWPWLAAGIAALGLGGLLTSVTMRRRRGIVEQQREELSEARETERPEQHEPTEQAPLMERESPRSDAETAPLSADDDVMPDSFIAGFPTEEDSDDADVLSEADIYIAYGRYHEAEVLLKEELGKYPGRADLQFKLAEAYYGAGNGDALKTLSDQMRRSGADRQDVEQWQGLVSMREALESREDDLSGTPARDRRTAAIAGGVADTGTADNAGPDSEMSLDLGLDLSPREKTPQGPGGAAAMSGMPIAGDGVAMDRLPEIDELDLDILEEPSAPGTRIAADADSLDLGLPELDAVDLPSVQGASGVADIPYAGAAAEIGEPTAIDSIQSHAGEAGSAQPKVSTPIRELSDDDFASELLSSQWRMDSDAWDEIGTKMELALAYLEMDDHDGARAILEEVKRDGNDDQRAEAEELLAKLP